MKRITDKTTERAKNALLDCIEKTAGIEDPAELNEKAFDVLYSHLGDSPELLKRACEAYNHKKTLYKLESADDSTRGDSFAILDAPSLYAKARAKHHTVEMTKTASAEMKPRFWADKREEPAEPVRKVASASSPKQEVYTPPKYSDRDVEYMLVDELRKSANLIYKYATELDSDRKAFADNCDKVVREFALMPKPMQKKAASLLSTVMGMFGDFLIENYNEQRPMNKIASVEHIQSRGSLRFPKEDIYRYAKLAKKAFDSYHREQDALLDFMDDITIHLRRDFVPTMRLPKKAAGVASVILANGILQNMPEAFGINDDSYDKVSQSLLTPTIQNKTRELSTKRALYELYNDDYISSFPDEQIVDAFNNILQQLPPSERLRPALNTALIKARVIDYLGRGGVASAADADKIIEQTKGLADQAKYRSDVENLKNSYSEKAKTK